jgi:hypothetical protein
MTTPLQIVQHREKISKMQAGEIVFAVEYAVQYFKTIVSKQYNFYLVILNCILLYPVIVFQ